MTLAEESDDTLSFRSAGEDHPDLELHRAEAGGIDHIALSVENEAALRQLVDTVADAGHEIVREISLDRRLGSGLSAAVQDVEGNRIELVVPGSGEASLSSERSPGRRLGHVVLWTSRIGEQEAFYALLGFQVSDRTHIGMSFLRCNLDHHSIALVSGRSGQRGLQHVAYDIGTVDDVMREYARLREDGVECIWGVGRHGPGNNVFSYFRDPGGNVVENYGDMEKVDDPEVSEARFWGPEHKGDVWGVAGPPPRAFRG